jgi:hypothetical protein
MGKSFKDTTKQPKKNTLSKVLRVKYEEDEAEQDMGKYIGQSFMMVKDKEEKE